MVAALIPVAALAALVLVAFVGLVVGIHHEPSNDELSSSAPSPLAEITRRLLGVGVRRPADIEASREPYLTGHAVGRNAEGR